MVERGVAVVVEDDDDVRGILTEVLQQHGGSTRPFVLLYPHARHISRRVRAFVDFLVDKLAD